MWWCTTSKFIEVVFPKSDKNCLLPTIAIQKWRSGKSTKPSGACHVTNKLGVLAYFSEIYWSFPAFLWFSTHQCKVKTLFDSHKSCKDERMVSSLQGANNSDHVILKKLLEYVMFANFLQFVSWQITNLGHLQQLPWSFVSETARATANTLILFAPTQTTDFIRFHHLFHHVLQFGLTFIIFYICIQFKV